MLEFARDGEGRVVEQSSGECTPYAVDQWPIYRKHARTRATRIHGPFVVETSEGPLRCEDGYLAVDARGYPYPIAADEFPLIYVPDEPQTVVEAIAELESMIRDRQMSGWGDARELAIALTALEDCQMRFTRGRAKTLGVFDPVDLEKGGGLAAAAREERARFEAAAGEAGGE